MAPGRPYKLFDSWFEFVRLLKRTTIHPSPDLRMESFLGDGLIHNLSLRPKNWTLLTSFQQRSTNAWKGPISLGFIGAFGFIRLCSTQAFRQFDFYLHKASRNAFYAIKKKNMLSVETAYYTRSRHYPYRFKSHQPVLPKSNWEAKIRVQWSSFYSLNDIWTEEFGIGIIYYECYSMLVHMSS